MKIIKPSYEIMTEFDGNLVLKRLEKCGRVCYKSEDKITENSANKMVAYLIKNKHESPLEHFNITVKFICDRGVMAELTRHRIASFSVESTRYCNYSKDKFGNSITCILPTGMNDLICGEFTAKRRQDVEYEKLIKRMKDQPNEKETLAWFWAMYRSEMDYFHMLDLGITPEIARGVLPNSLKTEVIMTANLREWRHIFKLRADKAAHPQMRELMIPLLKELQTKIPVVFNDIVV